MNESFLETEMNSLCPASDKVAISRAEFRYRALRKVQELSAENTSILFPYAERLFERLETEKYHIVREGLFELVSRVNTTESRELLYQIAISSDNMAYKAVAALMESIRRQREQHDLPPV